VSVVAVFLAQATEDLADTHTMYESIRVGLGDRFLAATSRQIDQVRITPLLYAVFRRGVRAAPIKGFPYVLYYRKRELDLLIVAIQHGRRSTRGWRDRV